MSRLSIRDAVPADLQTILALVAAGNARGLAVDTATFADPRYLRAFDAIFGDPAQRLVVAEHEGEVVGTLQITIIPGLANFGLTRGLLESVHIRADQRGSGLGSEFVRWAIDHCRERGCGLVQLTSNKVRADAHRFYRKLGFQQSHEGFKLVL